MLVSITHELMKYSKQAQLLREKQVPIMRRIQTLIQTLGESRQATEKIWRENIRDMEHAIEEYREKLDEAKKYLDEIDALTLPQLQEDGQEVAEDEEHPARKGLNEVRLEWEDTGRILQEWRGNYDKTKKLVATIAKSTQVGEESEEKKD